jgi:hypothetical protein
MPNTTRRRGRQAHRFRPQDRRTVAQALVLPVAADAMADTYPGPAHAGGMALDACEADR